MKSGVLRITVGLAFLTGSTAIAADNGAATPDFSGTWARQAFGFEAPPSGQGPGPIENLVRRASGIGSNLNMLVGDYQNPILKPEAAEHLRQRGEISRSGAAFPDPSNQCHPQPPPFVLGLQRHVRFLQRDNEIVIIYEGDQQIRRVRMNQQHPANMTPTRYGDSVGRFQGDTLIVDTVGFRVGPLSMVDEFGTPHSEALHLVERYRLVDDDVAKEATQRAIREKGYANASAINEGVVFDRDYAGKGLQVQFTVEDPNTFTTRWSAAVTYRRSGTQWVEYVCAENTREYYDNKDTAVPTNGTPDF
jgi:hypothetical protein